MKKIRQNLLHICLTITILISILFSALIWINPATFQRSETTQHKDTAVENTSNYALTDVYFPTSILYNGTKQQYLLSSKKVDLVRNIKALGKIWSTKTFKELKGITATSYYKYLTKAQAVVLKYPATVTTGLFNKMSKKDNIKNIEFNWMVITLNKPYTAYLLNDKGQKVYQLTTKSNVSAKLQTLLKDNRVKQTQITYQKLANRYIVSYPNQIEVARYSYLVNKENAGVYIGRLLGTSNSGSVNTREQKNETTYLDDNGKKIVVNNQTDEVSFVNYNQTFNMEKSHTLSFYLQQNFKLLNMLGVSLDDIRYDGYDSKSGMTVYRSYINSYPIIAQNCYGTFKTQTKISGTQQLNFSLDSLQIPVPANGQSTVLEPTTTILTNLLNQGLKENKIENIVVGYAWSDNAGAEMVVDLTPTYFVNYDGVWYDYRLLSQGIWEALE